MSIKYHQYGIEYDYGEDHTLTDNWNPNLDYGNEYVHLYFSIDTPSYATQSFASNKDRDAWRTEVSNIISSFGIMEGSGFDYEKKKCAYLFAHPQQISGVILKNDVKKIAEALSHMKLSSIRWVGLRETIYDISDDAYEEYLDGRKAEIRKAIFTLSATARTTKYRSAIDIARTIAETVRMHRLGLDDGKHTGSGQTIDYILKVIDEMIEEGYLRYFQEHEDKYIRSLNKAEQKQSKLPNIT